MIVTGLVIEIYHVGFEPLI